MVGFSVKDMGGNVVKGALVAVLALLIGGSASLWAQTKEVRGIVLDAEESTPLVAATVGALAPGSTTEVVASGITDLDGRFRLDVPRPPLSY